MDFTPTTTSPFYSSGFFGYGQKGDFKIFSLAHFIPVIILVCSIVVLYIFKDKIKNSKYENTIRVTIAFINLMSEFAYYWRVLYVGGDTSKALLITKLPLQACDWACIISSIMMFNKNEKLFQYCCCAVLTLGIIPLFYPNAISKTGPTYFRYYQFWLNHSLPIFSTYYMIYIHGFKPRKIAIVYALGFLIPLGLLSAYLNNKIPKAYFMYLNSKNAIARLLPTNQYLKIVILGLFMIGLYLIIYKIFNRKKKS